MKNLDPRLTTSKDHSYFWEIQIELIQLLGMVGFLFNLSDRIPAFWLRNRIQQVTDNVDPKLIEDIVFLLDALVEERVKGNEPKNNGQKYL